MLSKHLNIKGRATGQITSFYGFLCLFVIIVSLKFLLLLLHFWGLALSLRIARQGLYHWATHSVIIFLVFTGLVGERGCSSGPDGLKARWKHPPSRLVLFHSKELTPSSRFHHRTLKSFPLNAVQSQTKISVPGFVMWLRVLRIGAFSYSWLLWVSKSSPSQENVCL